MRVQACAVEAVDTRERRLVVFANPVNQKAFIFLPAQHVTRAGARGVFTSVAKISTVQKSDTIEHLVET